MASDTKGQPKRSNSILTLLLFLTLCMIALSAAGGVLFHLHWQELKQLKEKIGTLETVLAFDKSGSPVGLPKNVEMALLVEMVDETSKRLETVENKLKLDNNYPKKRDTFSLHEQVFEHNVKQHTDILLDKVRRQSSLPDGYLQLIEEFAKQQVQILEKHCGNASKICLAGAKGDPGTTGQKGDAGVKGAAGRDGIPGPKGKSGQFGPSGPQGPRGNDGPVGPKGDHGPKGDKGDTGVQGVGIKGDKAIPKFKGPSTATTVVVNHGDDIKLTCNPGGYPPPEVIWTPEVDPQGRYHKTNDGSLIVSNTNFVDEKVFKCQASNVFGTTQKQYQLVVKDPLSVSITPTSSTATGQMFENFVCTFSGHPQPNVTWYHIRPDGKREQVTSGITGSATQSEIVIPHAGGIDGGQYICEVYNGIEGKQAVANFTVYSKPVIVVGPSNQIVKPGDTVILRCDVIGIPKPTIEWTFPKTGKTIPKGSFLNADGSVTILHVDSFAEGPYRCRAKNSYGETVSTGLVTVNEPMSVVTSPHEVAVKAGEQYKQIQCTGSGNPKPTVSWSKQGAQPLSSYTGKYISLNNGELIITSVNPNTDTGIYICNGTNGQKTDSDKTIVYKDVGNLSCTYTFGNCTNTVGQACGGHCPGNCDISHADVYGYRFYTLDTPVCPAGIHMGNVNGAGGKVKWHVENKQQPYEAHFSNGISSLYSSSRGPSADIWSPNTSTVAHASQPQFVGK